MKVALVENFGLDFYKARLRYAHFLRKKGNEVIVIIPNDGFQDAISDEGFKTIVVGSNIRGRNLKHAMEYVLDLVRIFRRESFDLIHFYRLQPNIIGTPIARLFGRAKLYNHITGLGYFFTKKTFLFQIAQFVIRLLYKTNSHLWGAHLIYQNQQDRDELRIYMRSIVIPGSAVNEDVFQQDLLSKLERLKLKTSLGLQADHRVVLFVSRLLKQKGLRDLVDAVNMYNEKHQYSLDLLIAGWIDERNPDSFTAKEIAEIGACENIRVLGKRDDINQLITISDIAALPTYYREGTPRFLLESMCIGRAILTTNMPGCDHLVHDRRNGVLIDPRSSSAVLSGLEQLIQANLVEMGDNSRQIYFKYFSEEVVYSSIYNFYYAT